MGCDRGYDRSEDLDKEEVKAGNEKREMRKKVGPNPDCHELNRVAKVVKYL